MTIEEIVLATGPIGTEAFAAMQECLLPFKFHKGAVVMRQNEICNYVFIVSEGVFRNFVIDDEGEDHTRWFAEDGDIFTSMVGFSSDQPSIASVETLCVSSGWRMTISDCKRLLNDFPEWSQWANNLFISGLAVMERRYRFLGTGNAYTRFCNLYQWRRAEVINHIPLQHIASYLGVTPQSISRFRRKRATRK